MKPRVRLSFGSCFGCHVFYHLGDHVHLLGVSGGCKHEIQARDERHRTRDPVKESGIRDLCGIYLEDSTC